MTPPRPPVDPGHKPAAELDVPPPFAKEGDPYTLDELLSGLPPVNAQDALLLSELAPPPSVPPEGWMDAAEPPPTVDAVNDNPTPDDAGDDQDSNSGEDEWDPSALSMGNIVAALHALAEDAPPPAEDEDDDGLLVLGDEHLVAAPTPEPAPEPAPEPEAADASGALANELAARIEAIIAAHSPQGREAESKGDSALPERLDALALLLSDPPPAEDFAALDALYACWPKTTLNCPSRALLAVAHNLGRNFGLPGKLPMATTKAWRMLSPTIFEAELAQRLADTDAFIAEWQRSQRTFLILEFGEVELIEYLFEALHPGYHADLLAGVMNFKVLSNRRMGLIRRIPTRVRKQVSALLPAGKDQALVELAHAKALVQQIGNTGFAPIADAAGKALEDIEKLMKAVANAGAPPPPAPPGGGMPLGRIG
ncbi:MAG: hypothetical protein ACM31D_01045 [Bacteroidota bacterium]